jgi:hypothetical protein
MAIAVLAGTHLPAEAQRGSVAAPRHLRAGAWTADARFAFDHPDELLTPGGLAAGGGVIVVCDRGDGRLKAFAPDGRLLWRFGRKGQGPNEFLGVSDLKYGPDGNFWVSDPPNGRLTVVSPAGKPVRIVTMGVNLHRVVPLPAGDFLGFGSGADRFLVRYDSVGRRVAPLPLPAEIKLPVTQAGFLVTEPTFGLLPSGGAVMGFRWLSKLVLLTPDGAVRKVVETVESLPTPTPESADVTYKNETFLGFRVNRSTPWASINIAIDSPLALVRFSGTSKEGPRLIDTYDMTTGEYVGSSLLPEHPVHIAAMGGTLYAVVDEPEPAVRAWRWVAKARPKAATAAPATP